MVGIVVVSHSAHLAEGIVELAKLIAQDCPVAAAGGLEDGSFGTSYERIMNAIESVHGSDGVLVLMDRSEASGLRKTTSPDNSLAPRRWGPRH